MYRFQRQIQSLLLEEKSHLIAVLDVVALVTQPFEKNEPVVVTPPLRTRGGEVA